MRYGILILLLSQLSAQTPEYTKDGQLVRPGNYREWVFLSSGLGMNYGPIADENRGREPVFDNVFVSPAAYKAFMNSGKWPDKTMFVLEVRSSRSTGSINNGGHYQADVVAVEAEVKDEARFPGKWAFFAFGKSGEKGTLTPTTARCYTCHSSKGAVDNTFVQFYPTLLEVARRKGTLTAEYLAGEGKE